MPGSSKSDLFKPTPSKSDRFKPEPYKSDPSQDAAALLRRIGFAAMMLGLPVTALAGPSGAVVAAALGLVLIGTASALDGAWGGADIARRATAIKVAAFALALLCGWAVLSLLWTPLPRSAGERLFATFSIVALGIAGFLALPDRMRSANLYFVPIGTVLAAVIALALVVGGAGSDIEVRRLERGLTVVVLFAWPSIAWLRSRGRDWEAVGLAMLVATAAALSANLMPIGAFALGALAYLVVQVTGRRGAAALGLLAAGGIVVAPGLLAALAATGLERSTDLGGWPTILLGEPLRLLTGHGYGSLVRRGVDALGAARLPGAPVLTLWYELGIVGALSLAVALAAAMGANAARATLRPGIAAAIATGTALSLSPAAVGQPWWIAALAVVALVFVAAERAQFRTRRPRAALGRAREA